MPDMFITVYKGDENSSVSVAFTRIKTVLIMKDDINEAKATW